LAAHEKATPIIDTHNGKASSANNFPFHNWFNFVLGYSPQFPEYMIAREKLDSSSRILDPFMGTGTTLIACKSQGIPSQGIDANNFMVDAARVKLNWGLELKRLKYYRDAIIEYVSSEFSTYDWGEKEQISNQMSLFAQPIQIEVVRQSVADFVRQRRPKMLLEKYISDRPLARAFIIHDAVQKLVPEGGERDFFDLALTSIIVPISNVRYGPGFGMIKPKEDAAVLKHYCDKLDRMITDLSHVTRDQIDTSASVVLGDTRNLSTYFEPHSVSLMMTSPPYPGDHEYTKHTRLELTFRGYASSHEEFQVIKKRMIRASTTNLYKTDNDQEAIRDLESIRAVTTLINERLVEDGATSGFEKLYTKLVWEYFGGMYLALTECFHVLEPNGKIALLVSDSHAFKMVHIQTAEILREIGERIGYTNTEIVLWQNKPSTSHKYSLRENILILTKPG